MTDANMLNVREKSKPSVHRCLKMALTRLSCWVMLNLHALLLFGQLARLNTNTLMKMATRKHGQGWDVHQK
ncbi:Uncharacterised protein [Klebsiella pneumoniae]|nr:Uncharacterised protein [Klebsiella pneumoniae]